jgi:DNA modification methylase
VLDPFSGAGTVGLVAEYLDRDSILIELNPEYADMARRRIAGLKMGPDERRYARIKAGGKAETPDGLPLFAPREAAE